MKYHNYSCDLDLNPFSWFFAYILTSPYSYYIAEKEDKLFSIIILFLFGGIFIYLLYSDMEKKTSCASFVFEKCKEDNEIYKKQIECIQAIINNMDASMQKKEISDVLYKHDFDYDKLLSKYYQ